MDRGWTRADFLKIAGLTEFIWWDNFDSIILKTSL
jgi:hypothetical protein